MPHHKKNPEPLFFTFNKNKMAFKTLKSEFVEVQIPGVSAGQTGTRWYFPDLPKLRYVSVQAIETYTNEDLTTTMQGNAVITPAIFRNAYLSLYANERQDLWRIPFPALHRTQSSTTSTFVRSLFEMAGQKVTWEKSYIELAAAPANVTNLALCFNVYYS